MQDSHDVPDPTDWLKTRLADFAPFEATLHCEICKEFYDTPMVTSCSHTFCSRCIRTSLSADGRCPTCRAADQPSKLRNNFAVQEIVRTFLEARPKALAFAREVVEKTDVVTNGSTKRKRKQDSAVRSHEDDSEGPTARRKSRRIMASQNSEAEVMETHDSDGDEDYDPVEEVDDGKVDCLFGCGKRIKPDQMDSHLDKCEEEKQAAARSKSRHTLNTVTRQKKTDSVTKQARIAELNYSMMKENALSKKLKDLGIPSHGPKSLMVRRHTEWVNIWNANCDSDDPRSKYELLRELDVWERTQGGRAPNASTFSTAFKQKDFDGEAWASRNKDEFDRLIADARRKRKKSEEISTSKNEENQGDQSGRRASTQPYADHPEALKAVRQKVQAANAGQKINPVMNAGFRPVETNGATPDIPAILSSRSTSNISESPQRDSRRPATNGDISPQSHRFRSSMDEHMAKTKTGSPCELQTHLLEDGAQQVSMFSVPERPVNDVDPGI